MDAVIVIMSVKPLKILNHRGPELFSQNQAKVFQHSAPFTKLGQGAAQAKGLENQWKRITLFEVQEPFPFLSYRQTVVRKVVSDLQPIEVAIDDISMRVEAMQAVLQRDKRDGADTNNLMRIIQGSVLPQV
jgi:hypothetical protein